MKYDGTNLKEVLEAHKRWIKGHYFSGISTDDQADFNCATLVGADLRFVDLRGAKMYRANLCRANLSGANLSDANLIYANLQESVLRKATLTGAELQGADLRGAKCQRANFEKANLFRAFVDKADFTFSILTETNFKEVDLAYANMKYANFYETDFSSAKNIPFIPMACPDVGSFIAWKKCEIANQSVIVKLLIPEDAKRSSATGRKCRADKAIVLEIQTLDGETIDWIDEAHSCYDRGFLYTVGKTVTPTKPFFKNRFDECAPGIHFFVNRQEAVNY